MKVDSASDVIGFLKQQHEQIKALFVEVLATHGSQREKSFDRLCQLMEMHEAAEEEVVHPVAKRARAVGEAVVAARLHEESAAKKALAELEKLDIGSTEFGTKLLALQTAVLAHAQAEERQEFEKLANEVNEKELRRMREAVQAAETARAS